MVDVRAAPRRVSQVRAPVWSALHREVSVSCLWHVPPLQPSLDPTALPAVLSRWDDGSFCFVLFDVNLHFCECFDFLQ
jgi:hypothetical protein